MRRALILQTIAFALLLIALFALAGLVIDNRRLVRQGDQAHTALCAFKTDLANRVRDALAFLQNHPAGIPGIATAAAIQVVITNQKATLASLKPLVCDSDTRPKGTP